MSNSTDGALEEDEIDWNACLREPVNARLFEEKPALAKDEKKESQARRTPSKSASEIIEEVFQEKVRVSKNGAPCRLIIYEGIVMQLYAKALANDRRALQALLLYSKFGKDAPEGKRRLVAEYITDEGRFIKDDLLPVMPPFMGRVCSGYAPGWGVLQTPSV